MKKFFKVFVLIALSMLLHISVASANEKMMGVSVRPELAGTSSSSGASLFGAGPTLEEILTEGWSNMEEEIDVSMFNISVDDIDYLGELYWDVYFNNPEYWYIGETFGYSWYEDENIIAGVYPPYITGDISEVEEYSKRLERATDEILFHITDDMTELEKVLTVHDYMVMHYEYDYSYSNYLITIMTDKYGVCQSYSLAFKYVMDKLGIECTYVSSDEMNHMWNLVMVNGKWYHIDLTWDDMGEQTHYGQLSHAHTLLSTNAITTMDKPHFGFDTGELTADDDTYLNASWHNGIGSIAHLKNHFHYIDSNRLMCSNGNVLVENLDGGDGWWDFNDLHQGLPENFSTVCEHDGKMYYNTDEGIYEYDATAKKSRKISDAKYVCGFFIDKNKLYYSKPEVYKDGEFYYVRYVYGGEIELEPLREVFVGEVYRDGKKVKVNVMKDDTSSTCVFSSGADGIRMKVITKSGLTPVEFESGGNTRVFFWDGSLRPVHMSATVE